MKKILLFVMGAVFAVSDAFAVNIIDDNPLYIPIARRFYSVSGVGSHTGSENIKSWQFNEEFGYGITNRWNVTVANSIISQRAFDKWRWDSVAFETKFRALDILAWKADLIAGYAVSNVWAYHRPFLEKDVHIDSDTNDVVPGTGTEYTWAFGLRGGYTSSQFTVAARVLFEYFNTESFNWRELLGLRGIHVIVVGLDGRLALSEKFALVGGAEYVGIVDNEWYGYPGAYVENAGTWSAKLGLNYNIDATKFVGTYVTTSLNHNDGKYQDEWGVNPGFGFGAKFGICF